MGNAGARTQHTQHAFLVAWGSFAEQIGLLNALQAVPLSQKRYTHTPQAKVLEFLVAILAGLKHLQDISRAAHPLAKDQAVAAAWGQSGWADYSGVSRTLSSLSWDEAHQIVQVMEQVSEPFIQDELAVLREQGQRLRLDGDLTGIPVSNTSRTYPNAAYGHMNTEIRLGYQAALVSLASPTYGRLWLSVAHHPGDTISCTQAEALVLAAEKRTGLRPWRRTGILRQRVQDFEQAMAGTIQRLASQQQALQRAQMRVAAAAQERPERQRRLAELEQQYRAHNRVERPHSRLAKARQRLQATEKRLRSRNQAQLAAQRRLEITTRQVAAKQTELAHLQQRLARFEQDNATNSAPNAAEFRLDAGFGSYENIGLLIEMGYELYIKPFSHRVAHHLLHQIDEQTAWLRVGANAEMVAWQDRQLKGCAYPLDVALERFHSGKTIKHSVLLHFGADPVTENLGDWFVHYNGRQTIEAGIKEGKQVFHLQRLKVRAEPAIYLQEYFVTFAANFIRYATHWLANLPQPDKNALEVRKLGIKRQVQVAAHVSAHVTHSSEGKLLRFSEYSAFAGKVLRLPADDRPPPATSIFQRLRAFFVKSPLIAQPLR
jgi:hypothetical protein